MEEPVGWVDAAELRRVVEQIAALRPDFVYEWPLEGNGSCLYTHANGEPGCIIGHGLAELGYHIPYEDEDNVGTGVSTLYAMGIIIGSMDDRNWLIKVQNEQDCGISWGRAVEIANSLDSPDES